MAMAMLQLCQLFQSGRPVPDFSPSFKLKELVVKAARSCHLLRKRRVARLNSVLLREERAGVGG
jgi:hypothetical protein